MELLFPVVHAQEAGQSSSLYINILLFGGILVFFYFFLWRPQAKQAKEHRELVAGISAGDEVMTSGGLLGRVAEVGEEYLTVEVAAGVRVKLQKSSVKAALPKGTIDRA